MFNPLLVLSSRFIAPVMLRFIGSAMSYSLLRGVIGTLVPFLTKLPVRSLLQIAFNRPIMSAGGQVVTNVLALNTVRTALTLLPGVTTSLIQSHSLGFS
jgi:hypothetical protein